MGHEYPRSTSEPFAAIQDCLVSDKCIWKKRFKDLVRENERAKQKFKEVSVTTLLLSLILRLTNFDLKCVELISNGNALLDVDSGENCNFSGQE